MTALTIFGLSGALELGVIGAIHFYITYRISIADWGGSEGTGVMQGFMAISIFIFGLVFLAGATIKVFQHEPEGQHPCIQENQHPQVPPKIEG